MHELACDTAQGRPPSGGVLSAILSAFHDVGSNEALLRAAICEFSQSLQFWRFGIAYILTRDRLLSAGRSQDSCSAMGSVRRQLSFRVSDN